MRFGRVCYLVAGLSLAGVTGSRASPGDNVPGTPAASTSQPEATSQGYPKRADGWWETSLGEVRQQYCVGNGSEEKWSLADSLGIGDCTKREFQRIADGWRFETVCSLMGHTATQTGTITGDFRTSYRIVQQVVSDRLGTQKGELLARRLGDCPAPHKPGDQVSSGMTFNLLPYDEPPRNRRTRR